MGGLKALLVIHDRPQVDPDLRPAQITTVKTNSDQSKQIPGSDSWFLVHSRSILTCAMERGSMAPIIDGHVRRLVRARPKVCAEHVLYVFEFIVQSVRWREKRLWLSTTDPRSIFLRPTAISASGRFQVLGFWFLIQGSWLWVLGAGFVIQSSRFRIPGC